MMIQRKGEIKSTAWQQVTGAIGHGADGLYNTSFYCDTCSEFSALSIFETLMSSVCWITQTFQLLYNVPYSDLQANVSHDCNQSIRWHKLSRTHTHTNTPFSLYVTLFTLIRLAPHLCIIWEKSPQDSDNVRVFSLCGLLVTPIRN